MTIKRIHREINDLKKEDMGGITLAPTDNLFLWRAGIPGPEGSVYEGGVFNAEIQLAPDYPFMAPKVTFLTRIYHMNISDRGNVCIDILKHNWSPALSIFKVVLSLSSLLTDPNPRDPLVPSIANEYTRNREQHNRTAREWTRLYARPPAPSPTLKATPGLASRASTSTPRPSASTSSSRASSTSRATGKAKASRTATPLVENGTGRSASAAIAIDDSDDEGSTASGASRKRKRGAGGGTLISDDDDADSSGDTTGTAAPKRQKVAHGEGKRPTQPRPDEVIVIDD